MPEPRNTTELEAAIYILKDALSVAKGHPVPLPSPMVRRIVGYLEELEKIPTFATLPDRTPTGGFY